MKWLRTYFLRCAQEKTEAKWCPCSPPILSPSSPSAHRAIIGNKASNRIAVDFMLDKACLNSLHFYGMPSSNQGIMDLIQIQCNELVSSKFTSRAKSYSIEMLLYIEVEMEARK